jgi:hypothetical protein
MSAVMICIAVATLGIDVGWQRLPEGGTQYIIQIEPQTLDALRAGRPIESDLPSNLQDIRSYRIVVGSKKLPRDPLPSTTITKPMLPPIVESPAAAPHPLSPDPSIKPLAAQREVFKEPTTAPATALETQPAAEPQPAAAEKPWLPLTLTLLGLFASFGGNLYLGWLVLDLRKRCHSLLARPAGA